MVPLGLRQLDFFRLRRIELVGLKYLPPALVLEAFAAPDTASVFDSWTAHRESLLAVPGITSVELERRIPGTIRVVIQEAIPVALSAESDRMLLVAGDGTVLPFDPSRSAPDLPVLVSADSGAARLLARIRVVSPTFFARISTARSVAGDVLLRLDRRRVWLRPEASSLTILSVLAVERDFLLRGEAFAELDGRFADQVVVRRRPA